MEQLKLQFQRSVWKNGNENETLTLSKVLAHVWVLAKHLCCTYMLGCGNWTQLVLDAEVDV